MGYYTRFTVEADTYDYLVEDKIQTAIREISGYDYIDLGDVTDDIKWYDWHPDMLKLSKKFPDIVFTVHGIGEEDYDEWRAYFKNGRSVQHYREEWTPPAYDEADLT